MNHTSPKKLRAELKDYLDHAEKEPVRIQRRSGGAFVLMNETLYANMQNEILSLQRRLLGTSDALSGKTSEHRGSFAAGALFGWTESRRQVKSAHGENPPHCRLRKTPIGD
jgi:PHD/YefM family antitoxin component YafN of YafNO toxin-antitoxin module